MRHSINPLLFRFVIWIIFPVIILLVVGYGYLKQSIPRREGVLTVEGLNSPVKVVFDAQSVPHIYATNDHDAFYTMGFLHAQDRLWQMDYQRRLGQGRLSEILGSDRLRIDQFMRTLGLYRSAKTALESLDQDTHQSLMAYVKGVNAWLREVNRLPIEYYVLDTKPDPWRPEDSLLLIKLMALNLGGNYHQELTYDLLVKELGLVKATELMPSYPSEGVTVTQATAEFDEELQIRLLELSEQLRQSAHLGDEGMGSNGWVVSGQLTKSGKPILANDPHLATEIPAAWYLAEIKGDRIHVTGATLPGLPYVVLGHNEHIAWGGTSLVADVQDLYLVRTNPRNEDQYEVEGEWVDMEVDEEWINVRPAFPSFLSEPIPALKWDVRRTQYGPLISDVIGKVDLPLALRWSALDPVDKSFKSFLRINYAQNWQEFKLALQDYVAPALNFLYSDKQGNIAYIAGGKIPIRQQGNGMLPVPGWQTDHSWLGYISLENMPQSLNPKSEYIVSANNKNHSEDYPYLISHNWEPPYRAERITEVINGFKRSGKKLEVNDFVELQGDQKSLQAKQLLPFFRQVTPVTQQQETAIAELRRWDGVLSEDSIGAVIYQSWFKRFNRIMLNDDLRGNLVNIERSDRLQSYIDKLNPVLIHKVISREAADEKHSWCDQTGTKQIESCEDLALIALDEALGELNRLAGTSVRWGEIHRTHYTNPLFTNFQILDLIFDRQISSGGDSYTVNVGGWVFSQDNGYQQNSGASYRQVIDLGALTQSGFITNTGQSGNILSQHYDDYIIPHKKLKLLPMYFGEEIGPDEKSTLTLDPKS